MVKNIIIIVFIVFGLIIIYNFRDHNQKRVIDACIAGSKKLDQPMTTNEAKQFCEKEISK